MKTAILVDGGFYRVQAQRLFGEKSPEERADELFKYCMAHLNSKQGVSDLYRIFYYDCAPLKKQVFNPLTKRSIDLSKTELCLWMENFLNQLKSKRKFAVRLGRLTEDRAFYSLSFSSVKKLLNGSVKIDELAETDLVLNVEQKGVDMKIGIDIASMAYKKQADQIILISGDSDFVPAAKLARREGIDFVLDPMGNHVADDLFEHIDGIQTRYKQFLNSKGE